MKEINVLLYGFGEIGRMTLRLLARRPGLVPVAVVDSDPALAGHDAAALCGIPDLSLPIRPSVKGLGEIAEVAIVATVSDGAVVLEQLREILREGISAVTACEELFFPAPELADQLREVAQEAENRDLAILATGVNPGFLMDHLPATLSGASALIESILVERVQDAAPRRLKFQRKIGAGLDPGEFSRRAEAGELRHVGLCDSVRYLAAALGWELARLTEDLSPVLAENDLALPGAIPVKQGQVRGLRQTARGFLADGRCVITLDFLAALGEPEPRERIVIDGTPRIESVIPGGLNGDRAACAMLCAAARRLAASRATGFLTMRDLPAPTGSVRP